MSTTLERIDGHKTATTEKGKDACDCRGHVRQYFGYNGQMLVEENYSFVCRPHGGGTATTYRFSNGITVKHSGHLTPEFKLDDMIELMEDVLLFHPRQQWRYIEYTVLQQVWHQVHSCGFLGDEEDVQSLNKIFKLKIVGFRPSLLRLFMDEFHNGRRPIDAQELLRMAANCWADMSESGKSSLEEWAWRYGNIAKGSLELRINYLQLRQEER